MIPTTPRPGTNEGSETRGRPGTAPVRGHRERRLVLHPSRAMATALLLLAGCGLAQGEERAEVPAGTSLMLHLDHMLHSERQGSGDAFTASVAVPLTVEGSVLVPGGSRVHGSVLELSKKPPRMRLAFHALEVRGELHDLNAELVDVTPRQHSEMTDEGAKIGGGAAAGAVLGGVIGGNVKGAVIGAAAGAAAGTGVALATKETHVYLPARSLLQLRLQEALQVRLEAPEAPPEETTDGS